MNPARALCVSEAFGRDVPVDVHVDGVAFERFALLGVIAAMNSWIGFPVGIAATSLAEPCRPCR